MYDLAERELLGGVEWEGEGQEDVDTQSRVVAQAGEPQSDLRPATDSSICLLEPA